MLFQKAAILLACLLLPCVLMPHGTARAGALEDVDRAASGSGSRRPSGGSDRSSEPRAPRSSDDTSGRQYLGESIDDCEVGQACDHFFATMIAYFVAAPWKLPRLYDRPCLDGYGPYPFHDGPRLLRSSSEGCVEEGGQSSKRSALDAEIESGFLLEGVIPASLSFRAHLPRRFELSGRFSFLTDLYEEGPSQLATAGIAHVLYRHAQTRRAEFRTGVGMRLFALDVLRAGIDVLYGVDAYLGRRGVLRIELHVGTLGNAVAGQARATIGLMFRRTELYAGYDHAAFAGRGATASLGGPVSGVRVWF